MFYLYHWVPGHAGLLANELADYYDKEAVTEASDKLNCAALLSIAPQNAQGKNVFQEKVANGLEP